MTILVKIFRSWYSVGVGGIRLDSFIVVLSGVNRLGVISRVHGVPCCKHNLFVCPFSPGMSAPSLVTPMHDTVCMTNLLAHK